MVGNVSNIPLCKLTVGKLTVGKFDSSAGFQDQQNQDVFF